MTHPAPITPKPRTPRKAKRQRAEQAELYVQALGVKGACAALGINQSSIWRLRSWLRGGGPVPHTQAGQRRPKLSDEQRQEIRQAKGREKIAYLALVYGVHDCTIKRIWSGTDRPALARQAP